MNKTNDGFINFIENNYFLNKEQQDSPILSPRKPAPQNESPQNMSSSLFGQAFKAKINAVMLNEKKLTNEIFQKLISEEKKELTAREKDLIRELANFQAKMIILENDFKEQKHKNSELLEKNLNLGKQVQNYLEEREEFLKVLKI